MQNDILLNMDRQKVTLLVLLDLSAAFDTVDHQVLLKRLESSFGITGTALNWVRSYLTNRSQRVCFEGCYPEKSDLPYGVPQGSCLGPLLFTAYAGKLFEVIETHLPNVHAYADDTQLYLAFEPNSDTSQAEAVRVMQECTGSIRSWMATDKLKLNEVKTEIILIGTNRQLEKVNIDRLNIGQVTVATVSSAVRNLGSWFDASPSMTTQINKICQSGYYHLSNVRQIRRYLTDNSTKLLVQAVIMARVDYCSSLLYGTPAVHLANYNIYRTLQHG